MTIDQLFDEIDLLPSSAKWRLVNHILQSLENERQRPRNWQDALKSTYGILSDDPIERPPQLLLEEREWSE